MNAQEQARAWAEETYQKLCPVVDRNLESRHDPDYLAELVLRKSLEVQPTTNVGRRRLLAIWVVNRRLLELERAEAVKRGES